ncbi:histone-lysine N-methyltransferase SETMAR-like [Lepeophtheirus salmonis]|uniref:histone-lysine N-methyltransferase SETMAR-like n=1 Tax=Lepeophtheirus salmonis TaxID=72036 RepID=UPI003AF35A2A
MDVEDEARSSRPIIEEKKWIVKLDRHVITYSIANELKIIQKAVQKHLHKAGLKKMPHELTQNNLLDLIDVCDSLLKRNEIDTFLNRNVTGDKKWLISENTSQKGSCSRQGEVAQTIVKVR